MPKERLKSSVSELRDQLETEDTVDQARREELEALANRIDAMINGDGEHWEETLVHGLEQQLIRYEEDHPVLTRTIQNVLNAISGLGV